MEKFYSVYATSQAPEELLAAYPKHALYLEGGISLFIKSIEDVTGVPPDSIIDIAAMGFNEHGTLDEEGNVEQGLTTEQLKGIVMGYVDKVQDGSAQGAEVRFSVPQGRYLYKTLFSPDGSE